MKQIDKIKRNSKYSKLNFKIEKQISVKDSPFMKNLSLNGIYAYVIRDLNHQFGFLYVTTKRLYQNSQINGKSLDFIKVSFEKKINFKLDRDILKKDYVFITNEKTNIIIRPIEIYNKNPDKWIDEKKQIPNPYFFHIKRIVVDKQLWFIQELKKLKLKNYTNKFFKESLNKAKIEDNILKILKTELFLLNNSQYMFQESHSIILTQGGTGKSSIIGILGKNLDNTSNAGMFGYFNVKTSMWISGLVEQTNLPILVDETNELIKKGDFILETLNKPLDNGKYYYGKAGGREVSFGNSFFFIGNINNEFSFEHFVTGLAQNYQTIGRRFCYIIYNQKSKFIQGGLRPQKKTPYMDIFSENLTFFLEYFLQIKKINNLKHHKKFLELVEEYERKFKNKFKEIEGDISQQFFIEYIKSFRERIPFMALKITIFDEFNEIMKADLIHYHKSKFVEIFLKTSKEIFEDLYNTYLTIIDHLKNVDITQIKHDKQTKILHNLGKYTENLFDLICDNQNKFEKNKLYFDTIKNNCQNKDKKRLLHYHRKDLLKYSTIKENNKISMFGFKINLDKAKNELYVTITNKKLFLDNCNNTKIEIKPEKIVKKSQKIEKKEEIKEDKTLKSDIEVIDFEDNVF